jgi:hypothetical protein
MMSIKILYLMGAAAIVGCASSPQPDPSASKSSSTRKTNVLAYDEIVAAHADDGNAYNAVSRLRPNWLVAHGVAGQGGGGMEFASVYIDGQQYGDPTTLKNVPAYHVADMTYYDFTQAGARFGIRAGTGGVIDVRMKGSPTRQ